MFRSLVNASICGSCLSVKVDVPKIKGMKVRRTSSVAFKVQSALHFEPSALEFGRACYCRNRQRDCLLHRNHCEMLFDACLTHIKLLGVLQNVVVKCSHQQALFQLDAASQRQAIASAGNAATKFEACLWSWPVAVHGQHVLYCCQKLY